ncbi:GH25 family lysozyme [Microbacterium sp. M1A1_1b]
MQKNTLTSIATTTVLGMAVVTALAAGPASAAPPVSTPAATAAPAAGSAQATTTPDPSLATMDATGNHAMGASIAAHVAPVGTAAGERAQASVQATAGGPPPGRLQGMDVSAWQHDVDFGAAYAKGARFAYMKVSEGVSYTSPYYVRQYNASAVSGLIRGGYVYAQPSQASGAATAAYFFAHGGGWSNDGKTLPPLLDIEYGTAAQGTCYGMTQGAMSAWISQFSNAVYQRIHRWPAIYTTTDWWKRCTGNSSSFAGNPLFVALYPVNDFTTPGTVGASWGRWTFWQWAAEGTFPGDQDVTVHSIRSLRIFAARTD